MGVSRAQGCWVSPMFTTCDNNDHDTKQFFLQYIVFSFDAPLCRYKYITCFGEGLTTIPCVYVRSTFLRNELTAWKKTSYILNQKVIRRKVRGNVQLNKVCWRWSWYHRDEVWRWKNGEARGGTWRWQVDERFAR